MGANTKSIVIGPFVDGEVAESVSDAQIDVVNPSSGQRSFSIPSGCEADVDLAVRSARAAFDDGRWHDAAPAFRKRILHRFADLIAANAATLDALDAEEMGKPVRVGFCNAEGAAGLVRFCAESVDKILGDVYSSDKNSLVIQRRVPRGVVGAIVPWNFPTYVALLKAGPALCAGNCVVLKPSEMSTRSALRLAELAVEAGLPRGGFNVVPGLGSTVGEALCRHGDVDMVTFTGSTAIGKQILQYSGQSNMKVVMAECGGKSPQIVFADGVDLDAAAGSVATLLLTNQGQICSVGSRLLVQRSVQDEVIEKIVRRCSGIVIGDAMAAQTTFGPMASAKQCARVMSYIEAAETEGAKRVLGGSRVLKETGGYFIQPTIYSNVSPMARIAQEEIFGPVLAVIPFDDAEDAIRIANGTSYGLSAYVWTSDLSTGMKMAKGIRSSVRISAVAPVGEASGYVASSEPARQSGIGTEGGLGGIESYLRRQRLVFDHA